MIYVKIEDSIVVQKQPYHSDGFVEAGNGVVCGMVYSEGQFSIPPYQALDADSITKLQAVRYFQTNGVWADIKTAIASDQDRSDRWDATTVLVIDDADVLALASVAEALTGKDVQTMFNEAREL